MFTVPFMFDCGKLPSGRLLAYKGQSMIISDEDIKNYDENGLNLDAVKALAYSYMSKQHFADFTNTNYSSDVPVQVEGGYEF